MSRGSYRAVTEALPLVAELYPTMCQEFLTNLPLRPLGDVEIPVEMQEDVIVRAYTSYTSYKELWEGDLKLLQASCLIS